MLKRITHFALTGCVVLLVTAAAVPSPQEKKEKVPKDQQEYELITKASKETNPTTKLQLLDQWKEKYPETAFDEERVRLFMASYQQANQPAKAIGAAKELLKMKAGDFSANYTITTLTPIVGASDPQVLTEGEKSAKELVEGDLDKHKPPQVSTAQWEEAKKQARTAGRQTLGWIAMQRKNNTEAERQFTEFLKLNPQSAQVSYWLGKVVLDQANPDKNELALFSFARAAAHEGEGALTPEGRKQVDAYLTKVYTKYAGTEEGLDELKQTAKMQALPPPDLKIESGEVRAFQAEQKSRKENPLLWVFRDLRTNLTGSAGDGIWSDLNGKLTPKMRLYVVSANPPSRPQTLNLSSERGGPVEVVLNLENRQRTAIPSGRAVTFEGVAAGLTKQPFRLTLNGGKLL